MHIVCATYCMQILEIQANRKHSIRSKYTILHNSPANILHIYDMVTNIIEHMETAVVGRLVQYIDEQYFPLLGFRAINRSRAVACATAAPPAQEKERLLASPQLHSTASNTKRHLLRTSGHFPPSQRSFLWGHFLAYFDNKCLCLRESRPACWCRCHYWYY
jgi:hypothetical protein